MRLRTSVQKQSTSSSVWSILSIDCSVLVMASSMFMFFLFFILVAAIEFKPTAAFSVRLCKTYNNLLLLRLLMHYCLLLQFPSSPEDWKKIASEFNVRWNFPNCLGAIDGKHINIVPPGGSGSYYFNYKGSHSIILMGICNANYEFIYVDVGKNGRVSDSGVWANSTIRSEIESGNIALPPAEELPNSNRTLPFVFVGNDAFPLCTYLLKPFPFRNQSNEERIFSYRLSRARRIIENSFGILASKFRILKTTIHLDPTSVRKVVLACVVLHNFLRQRHSDYLRNQQDTEDHVSGTIAGG